MLRRFWVPWWENPIAKVQWRYEWVWVYGFVHPASGETLRVELRVETYWWVMPRVNIKLFNQVLADFAHHFGLGKDKHILLSVDQAGWHASDQVVLPEGLHLEFLPAYSPELSARAVRLSVRLSSRRSLTVEASSRGVATCRTPLANLG